MGDSRPDVEGTLQVRCTVVSCTRSGTKQHTPLPSPFRVDLVASRQRTRDEFPTLVPRYIVDCSTEYVVRKVTRARQPGRPHGADVPTDPGPPVREHAPSHARGLALWAGAGTWPRGPIPAPLSDVTCQLLPFLLGSVQSNGDARMMLSSALSCTPRPAPPSASLTTRAPLTAPVLPRGRELRGAHPGRGRRSSHASYTLTVDDSPVQR